MRSRPPLPQSYLEYFEQADTLLRIGSSISAYYKSTLLSGKAVLAAIPSMEGHRLLRLNNIEGVYRTIQKYTGLNVYTDNIKWLMKQMRHFKYPSSGEADLSEEALEHAYSIAFDNYETLFNYMRSLAD